MDIMTAILGRRSIRKYTEECASEEQIKALLKAAMSAPTAKHAREMRYIVVDDRATLDKVALLCPNAGMAAKAKLGILICADLSAEIVAGYWPQDCAAAMENLLLAAHGLGLGAVWTGIYPIAERVKIYKEIFELPENVMPQGFAVIGHPVEEKEPNNRYEEEFVFRNTWGSK